MRIRRRTAVILAIAGVVALGATGIALAAASSTATFHFSPVKVPKKKFHKGAISVHTHTTYTNPGNANPGGSTERAQLFFDDDFKFTTKGVPQCNPASVSGSGIDMAAAMAICGNAKVGQGTAHATANGAYDIPGCVLAFNGTKSGSKPTIVLYTRVQTAPPPNNTISCANPSSNHQGNTTVVLQGVLRKATGDFGKQLDVNHIQAAAPVPLTDFKTKVKRGKYVSARCHDKNHKWNMKTVFTYGNGSGGGGAKQTVKSSQKCKVKH